jgi:alkanesulfonate monooxygenase SsuD/methylene tetrahydromethanopterin reductase-like flavin-dependent oxidoreductase (luciferase family)
VATVSVLAPDRFILGVGVGGENPVEFEAAGVPVSERGRRLDESIEIVGRLLCGDAVEHDGPLLPTRSPALEPAPAAAPPMVVGGRSDAALRRAARGAEGWLGVWISPRRVAEVRVRLDELAEEYGRPPCRLMLMVFVHVCEPDGHDAALTEAAAFVRGQYGLPFEQLRKWVLVGTEDEVADGLAALRDAGAESFVLTAAAADQLEQYRRFAGVRALLDRRPVA